MSNGTTGVTGGVPRKPSGNDVQRGIRIPEDWLRRADQLSPLLARPGISVTTTDVLRACLLRGLESLEAELLKPAETKTPKKK